MGPSTADAHRTALATVVVAVFLVLSGCDAWINTLGTVRDTAGKPISNVTVNLKSKNESLTFRTGADGRYEFSIWQPPFKRDYKLTVTKKGFCSIREAAQGSRNLRRP